MTRGREARRFWAGSRPRRRRWSAHGRRARRRRRRSPSPPSPPSRRWARIALYEARLHRRRPSRAPVLSPDRGAANLRDRSSSNPTARRSRATPTPPDGTTSRRTTPEAWPTPVTRHFQLVPTTCFNCEANCGLVAWIDKDTGEIAKFEGNPHHPASRGRNCAKGPATLNQIARPRTHPAPAAAARAPRLGPVGAECRGMKPSPTSAAASVERSTRAATTRSCTTSGGPATTATSNGCCTPGASTGTTPTPTSARRAPGSATRRGWASTAPRPTTPTPR